MPYDWSCVLYPGFWFILTFLSLPVNSISISRMLTPSHLHGQKVKPRWPPKERNFLCQFQSSSRSCTSVPVLCTTLIFSFCLVRLRKHSQPWKKCLDEILLHQFYIIVHSKGFIIAVWPKKCTKLSEDGKLMVKKKDAHLIVSTSHFSRQCYQISCAFGNLFSWKYKTLNSVWLCPNVFGILKLISIFWRHVLCAFPKKTLQKI